LFDDLVGNGVGLVEYDECCDRFGELRRMMLIITRPIKNYALPAGVVSGDGSRHWGLSGHAHIPVSGHASGTPGRSSKEKEVGV
jgi:hypothetical protein